MLEVIKKKIRHVVFTWPGIILFGVYMNLLSFLSILATFLIPNLPGNTFFSIFSSELRIVIGIIFIACFINAHFHSIDGGLIACFVLSGLQIINSGFRAEPIQIIFWLCFAIACVWSIVLKTRIYHYEGKYNTLILGAIERMEKDKK